MEDENLRKKLESEVESVSWAVLEPHHVRAAVLVISGDLDLVDVGVAMATDDVAQVGQWNKQKKIRAPTKEEVALWTADPNRQFAHIIIIQPFVLIQIIGPVQ